MMSSVSHFEDKHMDYVPVHLCACLASSVKIFQNTTGIEKLSAKISNKQKDNLLNRLFSVIQLSLIS